MMTITRYLDLLTLLSGVADEQLLEAMEGEGMLEQEVKICIEHFSPGRPARMYLPNGDPGYPADPPEWEQIPAEDYGQELIHRLDANPWTRRHLRKGEIKTIAATINGHIEALDLAAEVWEAYRARQEDAA